MKFSERAGIVEVSETIQIDSMNSELRSGLWNVLLAEEFKGRGFVYVQSYGRGETPRIKKFSENLWANYFKLPVDEIPYDDSDKFASIRKYFFECSWYEVYDFIEFCLENIGNRIAKPLNAMLERELSGFRIVKGKVAPISSKEEVDEIQKAITNTSFPGARSHLKTALDLLSRKTNPDYRNSIKESISAVESASCAITGSKSATLGQALKELAKTHDLHGALKEGFEKLYGYTSDGDGIRHAMIDEHNLKQEDAVYFLISCSAFINYLRVKTEK